MRGLYMQSIDETPADGGSLLERAMDSSAQQDEDRPARQDQVIAPFASLRVGDDETRGDQPAERSDEAERVDTATASSTDAYARILQRVVDRYSSAQNVDMRMDPEMLRRLGVQYDELRSQLAAAPSAERRRMTDTGSGDPLDPDAADVPMRDEADETGEITALVRPEQGRTLEQFGIVLRHGEVVDTLVGDADDRFNEYMADGERQLRTSDFFRAERSFERALRMVRGHPLASVGYGHAQLGAGLYRTSYHTLRTLLAEHPAMIDVRYETGLIPNRVRLLNTIATLEQRLRDEEFDRQLNGFLLAYIGHQLERDDLITTGLDAMLEADPNDPLVPLLREVWVKGRSPDSSPADDAEAAPEGAGDEGDAGGDDGPQDQD